MADRCNICSACFAAGWTDRIRNGGVGLNGIMSLLWPLLLHMAVSETAAVVLQNRVESAAVTAFVSVIVIPVAGWMYRNDRKQDKMQKHTWQIQAWKQTCLKAAVCFLAGGILNFAWSTLLQLLQIQRVFSNQTQEALLSSQFLLQIAGPGILVPIAEELIFRGLIYRRMRNFFSAGWAVLFSAALFAVYHGNPIQMIFAFPMAAVLAAVMEKSGTLFYPILFHMGANLTAILWNQFW